MNNDYEYVKTPLTRPIARKLVIEEFSGKVAERQEIIGTIVKIHRDRGGLPPRGRAAGVFKKVLADMKLEGKAENLSLGIWRISPSSDPPETEAVESVEPSQVSEEEEVIQPDQPDSPYEKIVGSGKDSVYLYYYPAYRQLAESNGESSWPCKVGKSERDPAIRVESQAATAMPEQPKIALLIQTDKPLELEKAIHKLLSKDGKQLKGAPGAEWFVTSPSEVEEIHDILLPLVSGDQQGSD
ncbi:MAG: GIY-YIG nuclease family protein [Gemmatimonadetes bacterium]|nr:GIY-YIG nuclease family protein [Gemmatimonadota bacterium]